MEDRYKDFSKITEEEKEIIDSTLEKLEGMSSNQIKSILKTIEYFVDTEFILTKKPPSL